MAPNNISNADADWLASLARQSAYAESNPKQKGSSRNNSNDHKCSNGNGGSGSVDGAGLTKIQRIERRDQKRIQREDRKRLAEVARQQRLLKKRRKLNSDGVEGPASGENTRRADRNVKRIMTTKSRQALARLSTVMGSTLSMHVQTHAATSAIPRQSKRKHYDTESQSQQQQQQLVNGVPAEPNGKATKYSTLRPQSKELQPRVRDYNGQGLVRPSLYIPFNDPSFKPKVEMEFEEHIPGFFGKAKQKAAKKQSDQNMLWKRCLQAKMDEDGNNGVNTGRTKRRKDKAKGAGVDTRVEELIRRGVIV